MVQIAYSKRIGAFPRHPLGALKSQYYTGTIMSSLPLNQMSRTEKIRAMEELWEDLSRDDSTVESPAWHATALKETEDLVKEGLAGFVDWEEAKERLRKSSQ